MPTRNLRPTDAMLHLLGAGLALSITACASPTQPGASVAAARPLGPNSEAQIAYDSQPVVLRLANGAATGGEAPVTTVDVATDPSFANVVTRQAATISADGQLTVTLAPLAGSTTYYWRARTATRNNPGAVSRVASFSIGPEVVIDPPAAVQPVSNTFPHKRPTFVVMNATHTGPSLVLTYYFEVATDSTFGSIVASGSVPEAPTQTSFTPTADLQSGATYYWRARASDATKRLTGPFSIVQSFTTVNPDDGVWRYTLILHLVSANCLGNGSPVPAPPLRDVSFDDGLVVTGEHLRYTVRQRYSWSNSYYTTTVALDLLRNATLVTGTLKSEGIDWPGHRHLGVFFSLNVVSGTRDDESGRLAGTAVGRLEDAGIPNYTVCDPTEVAFTLTPH